MIHQSSSSRQMKTINCITILLLSFIISGCSKELSTNTVKSSSDTSKYILSPEGPILSSNVHLIETGYHLSVQNGHVVKIHSATGIMSEDFGEMHPNNHENIAGGPDNKAIPAQPSGWITYAQWTNTSSQPFSFFSTDCIVPIAPAGNNNQLIYIFEGLENTLTGSSIDIIQPILQWGNNNIFGGNSWCIANWYVWNNGTSAAVSEPELNIAPGTSLQSMITYTGQQADGSYNYTSSFVGHPNSALNVTQGDLYNNFNYPGTSIAIPSVPAQTVAVETLEAYNASTGTPEVPEASDYPYIASVNMTNIDMGLVNAPAQLTWTPVTTQYAAFGEHTVVESNNSTGSGEVDLYFRTTSAPKINGSGNSIFLYEGNPSASGTITAFPGQTVNVVVTSFDKDVTVTSTTTLTIPGIDLGGEGPSMTVTGYSSSATETFTMPASGSVNWSASYTQVGGSSHPYDGGSIGVH